MLLHLLPFGRNLKGSSEIPNLGSWGNVIRWIRSCILWLSLPNAEDGDLARKTVAELFYSMPAEPVIYTFV